MDKGLLRDTLISKFNFLNNNEILSLSFDLTQQLVKFFSIFPELQSQIGASYLPLESEVAPVYQELLHTVPLSLAFPILKESEMSFAIPNGIPKGSMWLDPPYAEVEPSWFLVPGVGFDKSGARLGRGKGFYDRYLDDRECLKIGIAWSEQILETIPVESHDCHMDFIITELFCWNVGQQKRF